MIYTYRCPNCGAENYSTHNADGVRDPCRLCRHVGLRRIYGFNFKPAMQEHFNQTVGKPVSSMRKFTDELKRASDQASIETGMEHRYAPLEYGDHQAFGATNEGIEESNRKRAAAGHPLLPEIK